MTIKADEPKLGQLAPESAGRDAIHVAVVPIVAGGKLLPGDAVRIEPDGRGVWAGDANDRGVGVADPFFHGTIWKGDRFWLVLYPGTITGLRHVWSHPAFETRIPSAANEVSGS